MDKVGNIEEIGCYEEREIAWKITDFPTIAEQKVIQSATFPFADSLWHFRLLKKSSFRPGFAIFVLFNPKGWNYTVNYDLGFRKPDGSVNQLSKGILKEGSSMHEIYFKLPELKEGKHEVSSVNVFTVTLSRGSIDSDQSSVLNKPKLNKLIKLDTLSENFKDLFSNTESCDTILHVQGKEYKVHRTVLIARSSVFAAMFLHETSEKQTGLVNISDCDSESFEEFLKFLYYGKLEEPSPRCALHLVETSDKYNVQELKKFCVEYLMENLTVENSCDVVILAEKYEEANLMSAAQDFFNRNFSKILQTSEWDCLVKNNYRLSKKLLTGLSSKIKIVD